MTGKRGGPKDLFSAAILGVGLSFIFALFWTEQHEGYSHDFPGHLDYINFIMAYGYPPRADAGWETFQPPLYYYCAAIIGWVANALGIDMLDAIQVFSITCYLVFVLYASRLFSHVFPNGRFYYPALATILFWPIGAMMASRINNDVLIFMFSAAAFYYLAIWRHNHNENTLIAAITAGALAVASKSNGMIVCLLIFITVAAHWMRGKIDRKHLFSYKIMATIALALLLCASNFGRIVYAHVASDFPLALVPNGAGIPKNLQIPYRTEYLWMFDYNMLLDIPFFNHYIEQTGRSYFWVSLFKTALFGEFYWTGVTQAILLNLALLGMVLYLLLSLLSLRKTEPCVSQNIFFYSMAAFLPIMLLFYASRLYGEIVYSPAQNFRYIYPALIPFIISYLLVVENHFSQDRKFLYVLGWCLLLAFILLSISLLYIQVAA